MDHTACVCKPEIVEPVRVIWSSSLAAAVENHENKIDLVISEEPYKIACWENACSMANADHPLKVSLLDGTLSCEVAEGLPDCPDSCNSAASRRWKRRRVLNSLVAKCKNNNVECPDKLKLLALETWDDASCDRMSKRTWETLIQSCRAEVGAVLNV